MPIKDMKMPGKFKIIFFLTIGVLAGCISSDNTPSPETQVTPLPRARPSITNGIPSSMSTHTSENTYVQKQEFYKVTTCPTLLPELPEDIDIQGELLLAPFNVTKGNPYLLNLMERTQRTLPYSQENDLEELVVSLDRQWVAYFASPDSTSNDILVVTNLQGNIAYEQQVNRLEKWYLIDTWLNRKTLMLERYQISSETGILATPLPVTLLNPFTGEVRDLHNDFPNRASFFEPAFPWDAFGSSGTAYDPTLSLVAYAREHPVSHQRSIVLWNMQTNEEITSIQAPPGFGNGPVWFPDGTKFLVDSPVSAMETSSNMGHGAISEELFSVSRAGEIHRMTHFAEQFQEVAVGGYTWNPEGSKVALWVYTRPDETDSSNASGSGSRLVVVDLQDNKTTMFCVQGIQHIEPVWSPDGRYLLVGAISNMDNLKALVLDTFLLDLSKNAMFKIADETVPVGWMMPPSP